MSSLNERYRAIQDRILEQGKRSKRSQAVHLIAVSKKQSIEMIQELYRLGHRDFGENYVQELIEKAEELKRRGCSEIRWHFIGHLQTNKVKALMPYVYAIHAVDSLRLASEISKRWMALGKGSKLSIFLEVNIDRESSKAGVSPDEAVALATQLNTLEGLELQGLMCIPAAEENSRSRFIELRALEEKCRPSTRGLLSMGMSSDFEVAIQEGATHVRVGTALFGERN
jgi:pyridoxal phosphate enzyme (YggS family)